MITDLKVNGEKQPVLEDIQNPVFSWEFTSEDQFTLEVAGDPGFRKTVCYTDTANGWYRYDGFPLQKGRDYYWRVRSGIGEWTVSRFRTAD